MHWIDWTIVAAFLFFLVLVALHTSKYTKSVADFLSANRCARRYLLAVAGGMSSIAATSVMGYFEMYYNSGFSAAWWQLMPLPIGLCIALSGWVIYRFRQTRAMTLAQFFEMRYSRRFRIFAGILCFVSGILNYGIFPAVTARFFIYFCSLPQQFEFFGITISTFAVVMFTLLFIALFFTFTGGQIAVMVTDFIQGCFFNIVFIIITLFLLFSFKWPLITESLFAAPAGAALVNPFRSGKLTEFNFWFFAILVFSNFYNYMAWQGSQGYNSAALSPHEARMGKILSSWRVITIWFTFLLVPVCVHVLMQNPNFSNISLRVNEIINSVDNSAIKGQLVVPVSMSCFLPTGLLGLMCAAMLAACITNDDTYLHSWGCIFIQDVVMPFHNKPITPKTHMKLLRISIIGVAVFAFIFSLVFPLKEYIFMWFAITGAVYLGGAGAAIIGGLYWKKGTAAGAWSALITGLVLSLSGIIIRQVYPNFFLNGQKIYFLTMVVSAFVYIAVSLLNRKEDFNMDKMLYRGDYALDSDTKANQNTIANKKFSFKEIVIKRLGVNDEFTKLDKVIYFASMIWSLGWFLVFLIGTIYNLVHKGVPDKSWINFWKVYVGILVTAVLVFTVWYTIGGIRDIKELFKSLRNIKRNDSDDGTVIHNIPDKRIKSM